MNHIKVLIASLLMLCYTLMIYGHGMLMEPVNRGSAWREGFDTPPNYDDNANFCGGFGAQYLIHDGKCGVCGDNYGDPQPRANENGGLYGLGVIVRSYSMGERIQLHTLITANHIGYFNFSICPLSSPDEIETDECFEKYPIKLENDSYRFEVPDNITGYFNVTGYLPEDLACDHCVLRWHYQCGNNWGPCGNDTEAKGCGKQEQFRSCSDISIL